MEKCEWSKCETKCPLVRAETASQIISLHWNQFSNQLKNALELKGIKPCMLCLSEIEWINFKPKKPI